MSTNVPCSNNMFKRRTVLKRDYTSLNRIFISNWYNCSNFLWLLWTKIRICRDCLYSWFCHWIIIKRGVLNLFYIIKNLYGSDFFCLCVTLFKHSSYPFRSWREAEPKIVIITKLRTKSHYNIVSKGESLGSWWFFSNFRKLANYILSCFKLWRNFSHVDSIIAF